MSAAELLLLFVCGAAVAALVLFLCGRKLKYAAWYACSVLIGGFCALAEAVFWQLDGAAAFLSGLLGVFGNLLGVILMI